MAGNDKDDIDPSAPSEAYMAMLPKWQRAATLVSGTEAMREAGETYLPRHEHESDANYQERLNTAVLYNYFELTLNTLSSKPFTDPVELSETMPDVLKDMMDDIDLQGNSITVVAHNWFKESLAKGLAHMLIEMPALDGDPTARTREDDIRENRRPYWVQYAPENVVFIYEEMQSTRTGKESATVLKQVRILESHSELVGFDLTVTERVRVLEPGLWNVYEKRQEKKKKKPKWVWIDGGKTSIPVIPMVTFYIDKSETMVSKPPLDDLGHLNVRHWQSNSDQINILTVSRFPMLAVSGAMDFDNNSMAIGPRQLLGMRDPQGRFYYVEHNGHAIKSGRDELIDLEDAMSSYGADFLKRRPGNSSATARALDGVQSISQLQDYAMRFEDCLNQALYLTALWMGLEREEYGALKVLKTFSDLNLADADLRALAQARVNRDISRETFIKELQRRGHLSDEVDADDEVQKILKEDDTLRGQLPVGSNVKSNPVDPGKSPDGGKNGE